MAGIVKWWRNFKQYKQFTGTENITIKKSYLFPYKCIEKKCYNLHSNKVNGKQTKQKLQNT